MYRAIPSTLRQVSSGLAVTVVATKEVVPWRATVRATAVIASLLAFHHVMAAGAVNMHVYKSRDGGLFALLRLPGRPRASSSLARADHFDLAVADQDSRVWNFHCGGERSRGVQQNGRHGQENIVAEIARVAKAKRAKPKPRPRHTRGSPAPTCSATFDRSHVDAAQFERRAGHCSLYGHVMAGMLRYFVLIVDGVHFLVGVVYEHVLRARP